jgi:ACS family D-galactonate transporter-like MFS transporter
VPTPTEAPPIEQHIPRRRWRIAFLLGLGVLVNYVDRVNLSVSQSALHDEFGISTITFGYLLSAYSLTYAMLQLPVGVILDRFGVKIVGRISTFLWSVASFAAALSTGVASLFSARLLLGIGEAPTFPANAKATGYWFPKEERSFATSIFDAAAKLAPALGVPIIGVLLLHFGWRKSFAFTGLVSFAYFLLFYWIYRNPSEDTELTNSERRLIAEGGAQPEVAFAIREKGASLWYLLQQRKMIGLALGFASYNYTFYLLLTWLPSYLSSALHIDLLHSVVYSSVPWLVATVTDLFIGGLLVDSLVRSGRNASRVRQIVLVTGTALGMGIFGAASAHTPAAAIFWISVSIGGLSAAAPVGWSIPTLIAPRESVGRVGGIMNFFSQFSAISAPIITGYIASLTHSFYGAFGAAAVFLLIGVMGYVFLLGRIEPIPEPMLRASVRE